MFPEFRDRITQLKTTDHHFMRLFDQHNALDQKVKNMEAAACVWRGPASCLA